MNCFRSLYLWVDLQHPSEVIAVAVSCELLSFFVPLGWFTAILTDLCLWRLLWIAFVLCTFGLIYSNSSNRKQHYPLWIAFVLCTFGLIYSLRSISTARSTLWIAFVLCTFGLIYSNNNCGQLTADGWFTALHELHHPWIWLWIAFVLCTFGLIYSS